MASPSNVDLDFLDYTPTSGTNEILGSSNDPAQRQDKPGVQIRIPESAVNQQATTNQRPPPTPISGNLFQNLLNNAASLGSQSGMSDEALREIMWAANRQRQNQLKANKSSGNFNWTLNYLSQYFDVTTADVMERILWSAIPLRKTGIDIDNLDEELMAPLTDESATIDTHENPHLSPSLSYSHMERFIQSRPDLYGPFWISATLIFVIGIFSNIASYVSHISKIAVPELAAEVHVDVNKSAEAFSNQEATELDHWHYSMDELYTSTNLVMFYVTMMPTLVWFCFWIRGCSRYYTLTETVCAYGYSLSIFIPLAIMLTIQNLLIRYFMITFAAALSGLVLMMSFLPIAKSDPNPANSHMILAAVPLCQFGLAYIIHRIMLQ